MASKVIRHYTDVDDVLRDEGFTRRQIQHMSKKQRLYAIDKLGYTYDPQAAFGTNVQVTERTRTKQVVRDESGKITGTLSVPKQTYEQRAAMPEMTKRSVMEPAPRLGAKANTIRQIETGVIKTPSDEFFVTPYGVATGKAAEALRVREMQQQTKRDTALVAELEDVRARGGSFRPAGTSLIITQPGSGSVSSAPLTGFERAVFAQKGREAKAAERAENLQSFARTVTLGGKKTYDQRSWLGKYSENIVAGALGAPVLIGSGIATAAEKGYVIARYRKDIKKGTLGPTLKSPLKSQQFKNVINPLKPEGAATYTFAAVAAGGVYAARGKGGVSVRVSDIATKRITKGETTVDISNVVGEVKTGKASYAVKGTAAERFTVSEGDVFSRIKTDFTLERLGTKKGKVTETLKYKASGKGLARSKAISTGKTIKIADIETTYTTPKGRTTVLSTKDVIEVKSVGRSGEIFGGMKGKEFSFKFKPKSAKAGKPAPLIDTTPVKARVSTLGRFESARLAEVSRPEFKVEYFKTVSKGEKPSVPRGARLMVDEKGVFAEEKPLRQFARSKKGSLGREPLRRQRLITEDIIEGERRSARPLRSSLTPEQYKTMFGEVAKGIERGRMKGAAPLLIGARPMRSVTGTRSSRLSTTSTQLNIRPVSETRSITSVKPMTTLTSVTGQTSMLKPVTATHTDQITTYKPITSTQTSLKITPASDTTLIRRGGSEEVIETGGPPPIMPFGFPFAPYMPKGKRKGRTTRSAFNPKYTPSLTAVAFNIKGTKAPTGYRSGLVLRPIISKPRRRKR